MSDKRPVGVLITGASGFVGGALLRRMVADGGYAVVAATRRERDFGPTVRAVRIDGLSAETNWADALDQVSVVVHCAARVHVMNDQSEDPLAEFRRINVEGTRALAEQAAAAGVQRFVFVSSIKVNGESTRPDRPFTADDVPNPRDAYGVSKLEAEQVLQDIAARTGMAVTIVRPPLVYGPGVGGNFAQLLRLAGRGWPLPLGAIRENRRSMVYLENLVDLLVTCLEHPSARNRVFLVSDGEDVSTAGLLQALGNALGKPAHLLLVPGRWLAFGAAALGKGAVAQRLLGSLQVDIGQTRALLDWRPKYTLTEGLQYTVSALSNSNGNLK